MYIIYGKYNCPWCDSAKLLLESRQLPYEYRNIEGDYYKFDKEFLSDFPNAKSVPQIISPTGEKIGGFNELKKSLS